MTRVKIQRNMHLSCHFGAPFLFLPNILSLSYVIIITIIIIIIIIIIYFFLHVKDHT